MLDIVLEILAFFGWVYDADRRPEAQSVALGCAAWALFCLVAIVLLVRLMG